MNFPPLKHVADSVLREKIEAFSKRRSDLKAAQSELHESKVAREAAVLKDREDAATRLRKGGGGKDPGPSAIAACEKRIKKWERDIEVLELACLQDQGELVSRLEEVVDGERELAEQRAEKRREEFAAEVERLETAAINWRLERAYLEWLAAADVSGLDAAKFISQLNRRVAGLKAQNGEDYKEAALYDALKGLGEPPEPPAPPKEAKPLQQWPAQGVPAIRH